MSTVVIKVGDGVPKGVPRRRLYAWVLTPEGKFPGIGSFALLGQFDKAQHPVSG